MNTNQNDSDKTDQHTPIIIRILDAVVVAIVYVLISLAALKSRDPREHFANLMKPDRKQQTRIRNWQGVLEWSPTKRVGCFLGALIGIAIGGAILWYGMK